MLGGQTGKVSNVSKHLKFIEQIKDLFFKKSGYSLAGGKLSGVPGDIGIGGIVY